MKEATAMILKFKVTLAVIMTAVISNMSLASTFSKSSQSQSLSSSSQYGEMWTIHKVCREGRLDLLIALLEADENRVNERDSNNNTPLHEAIFAGQTAVCRLLKRYNADSSLTNNDGVSAQEVAQTRGIAEIKGLFSGTASNNTKPNQNSSTSSSLNAPNEFSTSKTTSSSQKSIVAPNRTRIFSLEDIEQFMQACHDGNVGLVDNFIKGGINVNQMAPFKGIREDKVAPLHVACKGGRLEICQLLVDAGAEVDLRDTSDETPLSRACHSDENYDICELLIRKGADVNSSNTFHSTCLHNASSGGASAICELLLKAGADVNADGFEGFTPLHCACQTFKRTAHRKIPEYQPTRDILIKYGADRTAKLKRSGLTPKQYWDHMKAKLEKK
jgi:ankyrin repeat protein